MQTITIRAVDDRGWSLEVAGVENAQLFRSGAQAERAAKAYAQRLAGAGLPTEIAVYLRDGRLGGRFVAQA